MLTCDGVILALIVLLYCVQRCRFDERRNKRLKEFPFNKYKAGLMALVRYDEKNDGAADVAKVTADEYAHQLTQREYFEVAVPENWAK